MATATSLLPTKQFAPRHCFLLNLEGEVEGISTDDVVREIPEKTPTMMEATA